MNPASLTILGSGSGAPGGQRACSGYLIDCRDTLTMLDCGPGVAVSYVRYGFDLKNLNNIVITHTHPDHVGDLPLLIQHMHLAGKTSPLDLYVPGEFVTPFMQMLCAMYVIPKRYDLALNVHGYDGGTLMETPVRIEAISNGHMQHYESDIRRYELPNKMQSFSIKATAGETTLYYSGDLASFDEAKEHLGGCGICIIETSHVGIAEIREFALENSEKRIVLSHLSGENAAELLATEFDELKNVQIAEDGMKIDL